MRKTRNAHFPFTKHHPRQKTSGSVEVYGIRKAASINLIQIIAAREDAQPLRVNSAGSCVLNTNSLRSLLEKSAGPDGTELQFRVWKVSNSNPKFCRATPRWQICSRSYLSGSGGPMTWKSHLGFLPVTTGSTSLKGWCGWSSLH